MKSQVHSIICILIFLLLATACSNKTKDSRDTDISNTQNTDISDYEICVGDEIYKIDKKSLLKEVYYMMMEKNLYYFDSEDHTLIDYYIKDFDYKKYPNPTFEDIFNNYDFPKGDLNTCYVQNNIAYIVCKLEYRPGTSPESPIIIKYDILNNKLINLIEIAQRATDIWYGYLSPTDKYICLHSPKEGYIMHNTEIIQILNFDKLEMVTIDEQFYSNNDSELGKTFHNLHWKSDYELSGIMKDDDGKETEFVIYINKSNLSNYKLYTRS